MPIDEAKPLSELLEPGSTLMVGTSRGSMLEFRPLTVAEVDADQIRILLDTAEEWVEAMTPGERVHITLSDTRKNRWAWATGSADLVADSELIDRLWSAPAAVYFDQGRETPGIGVLTITVEEGRYWTAPSGRLGSLISALRAKFGDPEQAGEHGSIDAEAREG